MRTEHCAVAINAGQEVLFAGGTHVGGAELASTEVRTLSGTVSAPDMGTARRRFTLTELDGGQAVLAAGGASGNAALATAELFDPQSYTWRATAGSMATGRWFHTATKMPDGYVLVVGGADATAGSLSSVELYNPVSSFFSNTESLVFPRYGHAAVLLPSGAVAVVGGYDSSAGGPVADVEVYEAGSWTNMVQLNFPRMYHVAELLADGRIAVALGVRLSGGGQLTVTPRTEVLSSTSGGTWSSTNVQSVNKGRKFASSSLLPDGRLLVVGGADTNNVCTANCDVFNPRNNT